MFMIDFYYLINKNFINNQLWNLIDLKIDRIDNRFQKMNRMIEDILGQSKCSSILSIQLSLLMTIPLQQRICNHWI